MYTHTHTHTLKHTHTHTHTHTHIYLQIYLADNTASGLIMIVGMAGLLSLSLSLHSQKSST